jgi:hypothetical protein
MIKAKLHKHRVDVIELTSFYKELSEEDRQHIQDYNFRIFIQY